MFAVNRHRRWRQRRRRAAALLQAEAYFVDRFAANA